MLKGLIHFEILELSSDSFKSNTANLKITAGQAKYQLSMININKQPARYISPVQNIELQLYDNQPIDTRFGYFNLPISKLLEQPKKNHHVKIQCIWKQKSDNSIGVGISATITVSLIYFNNAVGKLDILAESAVLERDTQSFGKMDPFAQINIGTYSVSTTVKDQVGKNPVWNQTLHLTLQNLSGNINIIVKDKDLVSDDIVGQVNINPFQMAIFSKRAKQLIKKQYPLKFKDQKAGIITIGLQFTILDEIKSQ